MKTVLSIAGTDPSGGAGIQADIKTITMNGAYAMSVVTALVAQNTVGVRSIAETTPKFLKEQLDAVFEDIFPDAVKIGMASSAELIKVISQSLRFYNAKKIVVDPVMVATSGSSLIKDSAVQALIDELFSVAYLITPNIPEAEVLSKIKITGKETMEKAAKYIGDNFGCAVLLKGGHGINDSDDLLYDNGVVRWFYGKKVDTANTHGTGCTLSSAIAANLAKGFSLEEAVAKSKKYIFCALNAKLNLGKGCGPLMHNFNLSGEFGKEYY